MAAGADDPRQVVVVVETAGVDRRTRVAQQQCADVAFGLGLRDRIRRDLDRPVLSEPDVAVRVDEPGQDPSAVENGFGVRDRVGAQQAVHDPPLHRLFVG